MNEYENKFSHEIIIDSKNNKKECEKFLTTIIEDTKLFKIKHNEYKKDFKLLKKSKKIIYTPEKVFNSSPLTIIDGEWGSGKTYFIEQLCKFVSCGDIKSNYINKIIVIDTLKYSASSITPTDFVIHLTEKLSWGYKRNKFIKKLFISLINIFPFNSINKKFGTNWKIKTDKETNIDKTIKTLNKYINKPVMVILDNIERVGNNWWDIIKIIQKLVVLDNFIFILPTFKDKLNFEKGTEWSIDKYVTIPMYKIKSDYRGILENYFSEEYLEILNDILSKPIVDKCFNLRQLENILVRNDNYEKLTNKYFVLIWFKRIWNPKIYELNEYANVIDKIIYRDINELVYTCATIENISTLIEKFQNINNININFLEFRNNYFDINYIKLECRFLSIEILKLEEIINKIIKNNNLTEKHITLVNWVNSKILYIKNNKNISYLNEISKLVYDDYLEDKKNYNSQIPENVFNRDNLKYTNDWNKIIINKLKEILVSKIKIQ